MDRIKKRTLGIGCFYLILQAFVLPHAAWSTCEIAYASHRSRECLKKIVACTVYGAGSALCLRDYLRFSRKASAFSGLAISLFEWWDFESVYNNQFGRMARLIDEVMRVSGTFSSSTSHEGKDDAINSFSTEVWIEEDYPYRYSDLREDVISFVSDLNVREILCPPVSIPDFARKFVNTPSMILLPMPWNAVKSLFKQHIIPKRLEEGKKKKLNEELEKTPNQPTIQHFPDQSEAKI